MSFPAPSSVIFVLFSHLGFHSPSLFCFPTAGSRRELRAGHLMWSTLEARGPYWIDRISAPDIVYHEFKSHFQLYKAMHDLWQSHFQNQCHLFSTLRTLGLHSIHSRSNWCHTDCWALISICERAVIGLLGSEWFAVCILADSCGRYKWFFLFMILCLLELNLLTSRDCLVFSRTLGYISNRPQAYPDTKALKRPWLMTPPAAFRPLSLATSF